MYSTKIIMRALLYLTYFVSNFHCDIILDNRLTMQDIELRHDFPITSRQLNASKLEDVEREFYNELGGYRVKRSSGFYKKAKDLATQMTKTLDKLVGPNYDSRIRPNYGGKAVQVELNMAVTGMGPVDEKTQTFKLDCYFRQSWIDDRLTFNASGISSLRMNWKFLDIIWKPDSFFVNGQKSKLHKITVPNRFASISPEGRISYSQRLTIKASCKMSLRKFPLDSQMCPLSVGSYGYTSDEVVYTWKKPAPLSLGNVDMAQFLLKNYTYGIITEITQRKIASGFRNDSIAYLNFFLERQTGYFLLQYYTPLIVIVMCSWVAFWIVRTDAPARCTLGITTILSITKIGFGEKGKPMVNYPTAMDTFVIICFGSVFAALLEFAVITFITLYINRYKAKEERQREALDKLVKVVNEKLRPSDNVNGLLCNQLINKIQSLPNENSSNVEQVETSIENTKNLESIEIIQVDEEKSIKHNIPKGFKAQIKTYCTSLYAKLPDDLKQHLENCYSGLSQQIEKMKLKPVPQMYIYSNTDEACEYIDKRSRVFFPSAFIFMMSVYWIHYLYVYQDETVYKI